MNISIQKQKGSAVMWVILVVLILVVGVYVYIHSRPFCPVGGCDNHVVLIPSTSPKPNSPAITLAQIMNTTLPDITEDAPQTDSLTLVNGKFSGTIQSSSYEVALKTVSSSFAYGDLNADGASDMVATIDANTGGTGTYTFLLAFTNNAGVPKYVASQILGDRIKVNSVTIAAGVITANIITQGPGEPLCCGTTPKTVKYKLAGSELVTVTN